MIVRMGNQTWLVAHRGDPTRAPENTLVSYRKAVAKGARAVETDVRRLRDGVWVAFHDPDLKRTTGFRGLVAKSRWQEVRTLDAGGDRIPRIGEVLDFCRRRGVRLFLDLKVSGHEKELLRILHDSRWLHRVWVGAGSVAGLQRWKRALAGRQGLPLFWVTGYRAPLTEGRIAQARRLGLSGFVAYKRWVTKAAARRVREAGLKLFVWTVRTPRELRKFSLWGVDGIMSEVWPPPSI